jgi:maltose alpha-D-glucosyltransferase/alpha-amylase
LSLARDWVEVFAGPARDSLATALQQWLPSRRWFRGKARPVNSVKVREQIAVPMGREKAFLLLFEVGYADLGSELYVLPLACAFGKKAGEIARDWPQMVLGRVSINRPPRDGVLYDAIVNKEFCHALLKLTAEHQKIAGEAGELEAEPTGVLRQIRRERGLDIESSVSKAEQSNTSVIYDSTVILKFFRRLDAGVNPELEIERFLAARHFSHSPALAGALEYRSDRGKSSTMAVLTSFVPGCHDAWADTLLSLGQFYKKVRTRPAPPVSDASDSVISAGSLPSKPAELIGPYLQDARTLGQRTAALHLTLASDPDDPAFRPEPWTSAAQQLLFDTLRDLTRRNFQLLRQRLSTLDSDAKALAQKVLPLEAFIVRRFHRIVEQPIGAKRIRTHGDYHLGQVLHHGPDFLIIDFEGEPALSLEERREKQSALRDVAGMIYSFFYAANAALRERPRQRTSRTDNEAEAGWARYWSVWVGTTFLRTYLETAQSASFIPPDKTALKVMLDVELLRKAIYELGYELNNRPDWVKITFQVLLDLLNPDNPI